MCELDVTDGASVRDAIAEISAELGRLDSLVNNAGVVIDAARDTETTDLSVVNDTLRVNLFGAFSPRTR